MTVLTTEIAGRYTALMLRRLLRALLFIIGAPVILVFAAPYITGVNVVGDLITLGKLGAAIGAANLLVLPILRFFLAPLILLTFGLLSIPLNMAVLAAAINFVPALEVSGLIPLFWLSLLIGGFNTLTAWIFR